MPRLKRWMQTDSSWEEVEVDLRLKPLQSAITNRPVDLTLTFDKRFAAPRKFVWVTRPGKNGDMPMPDDCKEVELMRSRHYNFLSYLTICPVLRPRKPDAPYLRWELPSDPAVLEQMWIELDLAKEYLARFRKCRDALVARIHPVFVEWHNGSYLGRWISDLCYRRSRVLGLFVQAFGDK